MISTFLKCPCRYQYQYCQYIDNRYPISIYRTGLPVSPVSSIQEINFVVLNSSKSVSDEWSLCSSMYVGFVRGRLTFFAVGQKNISRPWFSLFLTLDNGEFKSYFFAKKKAYNFGFLSSCLYQRQLNQQRFSCVH